MAKPLKQAEPAAGEIHIFFTRVPRHDSYQCAPPHPHGTIFTSKQARTTFVDIQFSPVESIGRTCTALRQPSLLLH